MHVISRWTAILLLLTVPAAGQRCRPPAEADLADVPFVRQVKSNWCWAAVAEMVMTYFHGPLSQCKVATKRLELTGIKVDCCEPNVCNQTGWPPLLKKDGFDFDSHTTHHRPLSWNRMQRQIGCLKKPVAVTWLWSGTVDEGHMMVAAGYTTSRPGDVYLKIHNPKEEGPYFLLFSDYVSKPGEYSHWDDFYDITALR